MLAYVNEHGEIVSTPQPKLAAGAESE
jgi:hypothetical protein